jgi:DNA-binding response OmpR family regulator
VGSLILDLHTHRGRRGEQLFELTKTEWALLEYLMRNPDQVLTRRRIMDYVWSDERDVQTTMVDVYISYLRTKLNLPGRPDPIETVRGIGYRLVADHA